MLYFDRTDVSEGIDVNKTSESKECNICHYWYFLSRGFKFQLHICNRCHHLPMMSMILSNIAALNIACAEYWCIVNGTSKSEAINLMQNIDLTEKKQKTMKHKIYYHI